MTHESLPTADAVPSLAVARVAPVARALSGALAVDPVIAARLEQSAHEARGTMAAETIRALGKGSRAWAAWCSQHHVGGLPASPELVAEYVDALANAGRKVAGIRQSVWAVGKLHDHARLPNPTSAAVVRLALKRVSRAVGTRQRQAAPLGAEDVRVALRGMGADAKPGELRDAALVLVMRDLLARRSEAVALDVEDVTFARDGSATALIRRSKTDQTGQGETKFLGPDTATRLRVWLSAASITAGPIFCSVNKAGIPGDRLDAGSVSAILKRVAERAGLDPLAVSGHSCRVGMAQDLVAAGEELSAVMQAGRWKSPMMPARYAENLTAARGAVARFHAKRR